MRGCIWFTFLLIRILNLIKYVQNIITLKILKTLHNKINLSCISKIKPLNLIVIFLCVLKLFFQSNYQQTQLISICIIMYWSWWISNRKCRMNVSHIRKRIFWDGIAETGCYLFFRNVPKVFTELTEIWSAKKQGEKINNFPKIIAKFPKTVANHQTYCIF